MKIISSKTHGILDYLTVVFLLASPAIFSMEAPLSTITYVLGIVHLCLTLLTNFEAGVIKVIPFRVHGLIEIVVAIGLAILAFWFYKHVNSLGFYYYMTLGIVILLVFILTDFKSAPLQNK